MTNKQAAKRFAKLSNLIGEYRHLWSTSDRLTGWVYEYDQLITSHPDAFREYCETSNLSNHHTGHDCLA
jgi:hypothetical protein